MNIGTEGSNSEPQRKNKMARKERAGGGGPRGGLPLNKHRSGNQQHKKDRRQYRGHEPLANAEFAGI
jgi:hypothetical protein